MAIHWMKKERQVSIIQVSKFPVLLVRLKKGSTLLLNLPSLNIWIRRSTEIYRGLPQFLRVFFSQALEPLYNRRQHCLQRTQGMLRKVVAHQQQSKRKYVLARKTAKSLTWTCASLLHDALDHVVRAPATYR